MKLCDLNRTDNGKIVYSPFHKLIYGCCRDDIEKSIQKNFSQSFINNVRKHSFYVEDNVMFSVIDLIFESIRSSNETV